MEAASELAAARLAAPDPATAPEAPPWFAGGVSLKRWPTNIRLPSPSLFQAARSATLRRNRQAIENSVSPAATR